MESVKVDALCPPPLPYSYAIKAGGAIYLARQVSLDRDGNVVGDTVEAQARQVWRNMSDGLDAAGGSPADVVKITYHMQGIREMTRENPSRQELFAGRPHPAFTVVKAAALGLPGLVDGDRRVC